MSKRFRFLLVVVVLLVATIFLIPSFRWYVLTSREEKDIASGSREEVKEYAIEQADGDLILIDQAIGAEDNEAALPEEMLFLTEEIKDIMEAQGENAPKEWTVGDLVEYLPDPEYVKSLLRDRYIDEVDEIKDIQNNVIILGLDLAGGMKVTVEADFDALERDLDRTLTEEEREVAIQGALEILNNRIDQFGVKEPQIRRLAGNQRIVIDMPGAADPEIYTELLSLTPLI